jgi:hypothetical protein
MCLDCYRFADLVPVMVSCGGSLTGNICLRYAGNSAYYVAVRPDRNVEPVRQFACFAADVH